MIKIEKKNYNKSLLSEKPICDRICNNIAAIQYAKAYVFISKVLTLKMIKPILYSFAESTNNVEIKI